MSVKEIENEKNLEEIHATLRNFRTLGEVNRNFGSTMATEQKGLNQISPRGTGNSPLGGGKY
tara:strand:- start:250 stop:435 length:186 start_codon:yes stop_codon:yes gene_type:complete